MIALFAVAAVASFGGAVLLAIRAGRAEREAAELISDPSSPLLSEVQTVLMRYADELAAACDHRGLSELPLRAREAHDEDVRLADALSRIERLSPPTRPSEHEDRVKAILQVAHTLDLAPEEVAKLLAPLVDDLIGQDWLGREVAAVEAVRVGDLVDAKTMWPLSSGTRVRRALGVIIRDAEGKVLSRAKVYCA